MAMLSVAGLTAHYGTAQVLFGLDFGLAEGSSTALLGRNGAGKTTTTRAIMGVRCRCGGSITYCGQRIDKLATHLRAIQGLQVVPEDRRIYARMTVRQNLELGTYARGTRETISVQHLVDTLPMIGPLLDRCGNQLSGGEQQLVAIARAMVPNPRILIMDEPSQGLAPVILEQVRDAIRTLRRQFGTVILLTEQNVQFALTVAEDIIVIDKGAIVFAGGRRDFQGRTDIQHRYLAI
jgi:ABC-type branched-subunit amino acid transport system ATPase component